MFTSCRRFDHLANMVTNPTWNCIISYKGSYDYDNVSGHVVALCMHAEIHCCIAVAFARLLVHGALRCTIGCAERCSCACMSSRPFSVMGSDHATYIVLLNSITFRA
jgi:hypothetical protein